MPASSMTSVATRGVIYGRASRDPKALGRSVDDQIRECETWAKQNDVEVVKVIRDDNRSASRAATRDRPGFQQMKQWVESGKIDVLIVWEASRAARNMDDWVDLRRLCEAADVQLSYKGRLYNMADPADRFSTTIDAAVAERGADDIRDRIVRTVKRNADAGRPHGRRPYGYQRVYDTTTGVLLGQTPYVLADDRGESLRSNDGSCTPALPDVNTPKTFSPEAQVLRKATDDVLAGRSLRQITLELEARGVPSPRRPNRNTREGDPADAVSAWTPQGLRQRLLNPTIAGRRIHRGEDDGEAAWAPIVDYGTWLELKAALTDPARLSVTPRGPAPRYLLSNIVRCGECGTRMKAHRNLKRIDVAYVCELESCRQVTVVGPKVDQMVEAVMEELLASDGYRHFISVAYHQSETDSQSAPNIAARIAKAEAARDELMKMRDAEEISLRAYAREDLRLEKEQEELREELAASVDSPALRRLVSGESLVNAWRQADLKDQREVIRVLLDVRVDKATRRGRRFDVWRVKVMPGELLLEPWGRAEETFDPSELWTD